MKSVKPLWGFGWAGWCLLPFAAWLAWSYFFGADLRYTLLERINDTCGIKAVYWTVLRPIYYNWIALDVPGLGWWGLLYVPIALQVHPGRSRWWWLALVAWASFRPELYALSLMKPGAGLTAVLTVASGGVLTRESAALVLCCSVDLAILGAITRSWMVLTAVTVATGLGVGAEQWYTLRGTPVPIALQLVPVSAWHAVTAGALLTWAVRARLREDRPGFCKACGYDLRGLTESRCPECGGACPTAVGADQPSADPGVHSPP